MSTTPTNSAASRPPRRPRSTAQPTPRRRWPERRHGRAPDGDDLGAVDESGGQDRGGREPELDDHQRQRAPAVEPHGRPSTRPARRGRPRRSSGAHHLVLAVPGRVHRIGQGERAEDVDAPPEAPRRPRAPAPEQAPPARPPWSAGGAVTRRHVARRRSRSSGVVASMSAARVVDLGGRAWRCLTRFSSSPASSASSSSRAAVPGRAASCSSRALAFAAASDAVLHRRGVHVDVLLAGQQHQLVHDLVGDRAQDEAVVLHALVAARSRAASRSGCRCA